MIGMVLVTHGNLALEMIAALEHIVGPQEKITSVCIEPDDNMEHRRTDIIDAIQATNCGKGVVILTDMFGGTPSNLAISVMDKATVEVIAGVNLPLLIKLATLRKNRDMTSAVLDAQEAGRKYIHVASELLKDRADHAP